MREISFYIIPKSLKTELANNMADCFICIYYRSAKMLSISVEGIEVGTSQIFNHLKVISHS